MMQQTSHQHKTRPNELPLRDEFAAAGCAFCQRLEALRQDRTGVVWYPRLPLGLIDSCSGCSRTRTRIFLAAWEAGTSSTSGAPPGTGRTFSNPEDSM
jgi:hypothetical protein